MVFQATIRCTAARDKSYLYFLSGGLFFYLKLAFVLGLFLASPVIFWQIWRFIAPGLYRHEKKVLLPFALLSSFCFTGGAAFGYFIIFPPAFRFLASYATDFLTPLPEVQEYFALTLRLLIAFGCIFELPIFMVLLAKMGVVTISLLRNNRKYAFLAAFVIAAIVTPTPDVVNQLLMAIPLVILYEISIVAVCFCGQQSFPSFEEAKKNHQSQGKEENP